MSYCDDSIVEITVDEDDEREAWDQIPDGSQYTHYNGFPIDFNRHDSCVYCRSECPKDSRMESKLDENND